MSEIKYQITRVATWDNGYKIESDTSWIGDIVLSEEEFDKIIKRGHEALKPGKRNLF